MHSNLFVTFFVHNLLVPSVIPRDWIAQLVTYKSQKNKKLPFVNHHTEPAASGPRLQSGAQVKNTSEQARLKRIEQLAKLCGRDVDDAANYLFAGNKLSLLYRFAS